MGWEWNKLFSSSAARKSVADRLEGGKQEPLLGGPIVEEPALDNPAESGELLRVEPTVGAPSSASLLKTKAWETKPLTFKPAPKLGLRVQPNAPELVEAPAEPVDLLPAPPQEVTLPPDLFAPAAAAAPVEPVIVEALVDTVAEAVAEEIAPPIDYLSIGRTPNTFGHASKLPADDERQALWAEQRVARGFDDTELWNLEDTIARYVLPRLRALRAKPLTPPRDLTLAQWHNLLDKMIVAFDLLQPADGGSWSRGRLNNAQRSQLQEGLDHFRTYFFALTC